MSSGIRRIRRLLGATGLTGVLIVVMVAPVAAHDPHTAGNPDRAAGTGQVIANGQQHPAFLDLDVDGQRESCDWYPATPFGAVGPSWYGIETAHHGPDSGDPGRGDGCYETDSNPTADVNNPAIR